MITGGIDVGLEYTKVVILKNGNVLAKTKGRSGGAKRAENVNTLWQEALRQAGLTESSVETIGITGKGKYNTGMKGTQMTELSAAQAAGALYPDAVEIVVAGADETLVLERDSQKVAEYTLNQKCSAGLGLFLEETEELLETDFHSINSVGETAFSLNDACVNFARMDLLEGINQEQPKEILAKAALKLAATKLSVVMNDITLSKEGQTLLAGGLFLYPSVKAFLEDLRQETYQTATDPDYFIATGAAFSVAR